jgi:hypothetical protein
VAVKRKGRRFLKKAKVAVKGKGRRFLKKAKVAVKGQGRRFLKKAKVAYGYCGVVGKEGGLLAGSGGFARSLCG